MDRTAARGFADSDAKRISSTAQTEVVDNNISLMTNKSAPTLVTLYVVPDCPLCAHARHWLSEHRIIHVERDVKQNFGALRSMYELTRQRLVPVFEARGKALVRPTDKQLADFLL